MLKAMQIEYDNLVMASRGNDAFPTEEDWDQLGLILRSSYKDLLLQCIGIPVPITDPLKPPTGNSDCG